MKSSRWFSWVESLFCIIFSALTLVVKHLFYKSMLQLFANVLFCGPTNQEKL